jgi:chromosome segregation ATPase
MSAVNRKADVSARRLRLMLASAVMVIVVLAGILALFYVNFLVQRDNTAASRDAASAIAAFSAGSETRENALRTDLGGLSGTVSGLSGTVSGMNDDLQKIQADLPAQRAAFEAAIEELKRNSGTALEAQQAQFEARIALQKEQFAAERLELLRQIDSLQERLNQSESGEPARAEELRKLRNELAAQIELGKDVEKLRGELADLSGKAEDLQKKNKLLEDELAAANRRASEEAEARKKAEADAENARRAAAPAQNSQNNPNQNPFPFGYGYPGMQQR